MFQDIFPHNFDNQFQNTNPESQDKMLCFSPGKVVLKDEKIPSLRELEADGFFIDPELVVYGFSIDEEKVFIYRGNIDMMPFDLKEDEGWHVYGTKEVRGLAAKPGFGKPRVFAILMGLHLYDWYQKTRFCGKCAAPMQLSTTERACHCPRCGNIVYPRISPVIIVGVVDGDKILMTKYADRDYNRYALIAGFMEFGETPEDTVRREVYEEAGLHVKNIRYYKSQPWPYPDSLLMGFYADLDGDSHPVLRDGELKEATWFSREEMPPAESDFALTSELMENFRLQGKKSLANSQQ